MGEVQETSGIVLLHVSDSVYAAIINVVVVVAR